MMKSQPSIRYGAASVPRKPVSLSLPEESFRRHPMLFALIAQLWQIGAKWCMKAAMTTIEKAVRQSISLPSRLAKRVKALAKIQRTSANRVLVELIETGLESKEAEKRRFFELADQLSASTDPEEQQRIKEELIRMTFGD